MLRRRDIYYLNGNNMKLFFDNSYNRFRQLNNNMFIKNRIDGNNNKLLKIIKRSFVSKVIVGDSSDKKIKEYDRTRITTQIRERPAPRILWQPYEEFPILKSQKERTQVFGKKQRLVFNRIFQLAYNNLFSFHSISQVVFVGYIVYLIGVGEAWLQLRPEIHPFGIDTDPKGLIFLNAYALAQILPSCVWVCLFF